MEILTLDLPTMYGDHHVTVVRALLLAIPGVEAVYASSCFQVVQITYDPDRADPAAIRAELAEAGYLMDVTLPLETGADRSAAYFRHTTAYSQTGQVIGFAQTIHPVTEEHDHGEKGA